MHSISSLLKWFYIQKWMGVCTNFHIKMLIVGGAGNIGRTSSQDCGLENWPSHEEIVVE